MKVKLKEQLKEPVRDHQLERTAELRIYSIIDKLCNHNIDKAAVIIEMVSTNRELTTLEYIAESFNHEPECAKFIEQRILELEKLMEIYKSK